MSGFRLAPITATDFGVRTRATDAASAWCSRSSTAARTRSVGSIRSSTCTTPPSMRVRSAKPAAANTSEHLAVAAQRLGDEPRDPALAGGGRQVLEQHGADSPTLLFVAHDERHLGRIGTRLSVVPGDAHEPIAELGHQHHAGFMVKTVNRSTSVGIQRRLGGEEPYEHRLV